MSLFRKLFGRKKNVVPSNAPKELNVQMLEEDASEALDVFRTELSHENYANQKLPKSFFGKSEISHVSFENTNLRQSILCWNDFRWVNFSGADLSGSDLRASLYENVNFEDADLSGADIRGLDLQSCNLKGSKMVGTKATHDLKKDKLLSPVQIKAIKWYDDEGEEPEGG